MGQFYKIMKETNGSPHREWLSSVPNDGVIRYLHAFNSERVLVTTPKALGEVLVTKNYEFIKPPQFKDGLGRILGIGVLLAEGDEHKRQRKNLMPAFAFRHVKDLYSVFWAKSKEVTEAMVNALQKSNPETGKPSDVLEVNNWASRATLDIIGVAGMGHDFNAIQDPNSELNQVYRKVFKPSKAAQIIQFASIFIPLWLIRSLPLKRNNDIDEASGQIKKICRELIEKKRRNMEKGGQQDVDILSVALESGGFSDEDLVNQMMTFLAAGHETTASAMTWAAYWLCRYPDVQKRLREEVRANLPSINSADANISSTDVDHCHYLHAVCNEILRILPPVALTLRIAANDTTIAGHFIPKGAPVVLALWAVNVDKSLWGDDADQFNPDRWMGEGRANSGGADSNYSFLTFLHGPRSCIGQGFAKAEFACLLAAWAGKFEMEFSNKDYVLDIQGGVTSKPKGGLEVRMQALEGW